MGSGGEYCIVLKCGNIVRKCKFFVSLAQVVWDMSDRERGSSHLPVCDLAGQAIL
jgi:hypothetical protein